MAEKAGITAAPTTWDELKAMAKGMQAEGGAEYGIALGTKNGAGVPAVRLVERR